ncbi:hypothetical protein K1T71_014945 [Dendrolimus kikuchii]|nr:hypothetical protein K1T71_014945 [Dendrolimus kikuchii]
MGGGPDQQSALTCRAGSPEIGGPSPGALSRLLPNVGGPNATCRKLFEDIVRSMALYGAPVWADRLTAKNAPLLRQAQCIMAVRAIRGYRTVLSGHGCFGRYLCRLGREPTSGCHHCDTGDEDTALHTLQECPAWTEQRRQLVAFTGLDLSLPAVVRTMVGSRTGWDAVSSFCEHVMFAKEEAERERERTS